MQKVPAIVRVVVGKKEIERHVFVDKTNSGQLIVSQPIVTEIAHKLGYNPKVARVYATEVTIHAFREGVADIENAA